MDFDVDAVITWVDGNDPVWQREKQEAQKIEQRLCEERAAADRQLFLKYHSDSVSSDATADVKDPMSSESPHSAHAESDAYTSDSRYRDWDNLRYWFRSIEQHCPWIRRIYFVTWGHLPSWLDQSNPKLRIVNHTDFIPAEYLPTFNSNVIDLNLFRIPGLAEHFISFNDDMFVIRDMKKEEFFAEENGYPLDSAILSPYPILPDGIAANEANNIEIINKYFSTANIKKHLSNWVTPIYGKKAMRNLLFLKSSHIVGVMEPHIPLSFRKSTFRQVWKKEFSALDATCKNRFRSREDLTYWLMRQWQLFSGRFSPRSWETGHYFLMPNAKEDLKKALRGSGQAKLICINDSEKIPDFESLKQEINAAFQRRYPKKSSFEV